VIRVQVPVEPFFFFFFFFFGPQKKKDAGCEDRTHDLGIMRPTLYQLSQAGFDIIFLQPKKKKMITVGIEPTTNGLLDQRSTN
jgi:hypothetical protein